MHIEPQDQPTWYVATNADASIVHHGVTQVGQITDTGMLHCICLDTEEEYLAELAKYDITPDIL